jgi:hypothetical protein
VGEMPNLMGELRSLLSNLDSSNKKDLWATLCLLLSDVDEDEVREQYLPWIEKALPKDFLQVWGTDLEDSPLTQLCNAFAVGSSSIEAYLKYTPKNFKYLTLFEKNDYDRPGPHLNNYSMLNILTKFWASNPDKIPEKAFVLELTDNRSWDLLDALQNTKIEVLILDYWRALGLEDIPRFKTWLKNTGVKHLIWSNSPPFNLGDETKDLIKHITKQGIGSHYIEKYRLTHSFDSPPNLKKSIVFYPQHTNLPRGGIPFKAIPYTRLEDEKEFGVNINSELEFDMGLRGMILKTFSSMA